MPPTAPFRTTALHALLGSVLLLAALAPAQAADSLRTTQLLLQADLLDEAEAVQGHFVDALVDLEFPDDGDPSLTAAIRSMFPPSRIRGRWATLLSEQLSDAELRAAEDFHGSVAGMELAAMLRVVRNEGPGAVPDAPAELLAAEVDAEGPARMAVVRVRTAGAALWLSQLEGGEDEARLQEAWQASVDRHGRAEPGTDLLRALDRLPPLQALAFAEYAASSEGRRFYGKLTASLDLALEQLATEHAGFVRRAFELRRAAARAEAQSPG